MPLILDPAQPLQRPGVGVVITSAEAALGNPARGVTAYVGRSRKGPLATPVRCTSVPQIVRTFGGGPFGGLSGNTMDGAMHALRGGSVACWVVRMGTGGTVSELMLLDTGGDDAVLVQALGPGQDGRNISIAVRGAPATATRTLAIYEDGIEREHITYAGTPVANDIDNLIAAYAQQGSELITLTKDPAAGALALAAQPVTPLTGGTDPAVDIPAIQTALAAVGGRPFEVIAPDFVAQAETLLLRNTLDDWILGGKLVMSVAGSDPTTLWPARMQAARDTNNPGITLVANGFRSTVRFPGQADDHVNGYEAAGFEAGRLAALPLGRQLTHAVVGDGIETVDEPAPDVIIDALAAGLYLYSTNSRGQVWTEQGLTTQTDFGRPPSWAAQTDSGWGKQRLVLTRFRLLTDIELAISPMIETTTNNNAGRESVRREIQNVIDGQYVPTGAVEAGTKVVQHPDYPPSQDRATFLIDPLITPDGTEYLVIAASFRR